MAKVTLVFEGENAQEVHASISEYMSASVVRGAGIAEAPSVVTAAPAAKEAAKSKKVAAKKEEPSAPVADEAEVEEEDPFATAEAESDEDEAVALTAEVVHAALEQVNTKIGVQAVRDVLAAVKLKKVKDIQAPHFAAVMAACSKAFAAKK